MRFNFKNVVLAGIFVVGVALVVILLRLANGLDRAEDEVINNRIVDCRMLVSHDIELLPDGPCVNPTVLRVICSAPPMPKDCDG